MTLEESKDRLKAGRNDPCPCGSGKKYKKCHSVEDEAAVHADLKRREAEAKAAAALAAEADGEDAGDEEAKASAGSASRARPGQPARQKTAKKDRVLNTPVKNLPRRKAV